MSKRLIWKYPLSPVIDQTIIMPVGSIVRALQCQNGMPHLWVECPAESVDQEARTFRTAGTNHPDIDETMKYVGTYQVEPYVWHVYEVTD